MSRDAQRLEIEKKKKTSRGVGVGAQWRWDRGARRAVPQGKKEHVLWLNVWL